jgi:hypothetical protein
MLKALEPPGNGPLLATYSIMSYAISYAYDTYLGCHIGWFDTHPVAAAAAAAGRYTYFVGVMDVLLHKLGLIGHSTLLSGASSGSLIAVFTKCGLPVEKVLQLTREFSQVC